MPISSDDLDDSRRPDAVDGVRVLADEIAFKIEQAILSGQIRPGEKLRQEKLCRQFHVSRTPIREALKKLQGLRLLDIMPNRGAVVRTPSRRDVEEVFAIRAELEAYATECATRNATEALDRALDEAIAQVERSSGEVVTLDPQSHAASRVVSGAIHGFHRVIVEAAGNVRLAQMTAELESMYFGEFCCHALKLESVHQALHLDEHKGIRDAIRLRQPRAAAELMRAHLHHARDVLIADLEASGFWEPERSTLAPRETGARRARHDR